MMRRIALVLFVVLLGSGCVLSGGEEETVAEESISQNLSENITPWVEIPTVSTIPRIYQIPYQKPPLSIVSVVQETDGYEVLPPASGQTTMLTPEELSAFKAWAEQHRIRLVAVNKSVNDFYYNGSWPGDFLPIDEVPNLAGVRNGLYRIPEHLLNAMNGKTFYLSYQYGRGYTVLGSWPEQGILAGMDRGSIIEQPLSEQQILHEFAHILDYHGIRGIYEDSQNHWSHLEEKRAEMFAVPFEYDPNLPAPPAGYMDVYSTANDAENFAQHFAYYILDGDEFRQKAEEDAGLRQKYEFFKEELFKGEEYS